MIFSISVMPDISFSAPNPMPQNLKASTFGISNAWICSPDLTARESSKSVRLLRRGRSTMNNTSKLDNHLELRIINLDSLIIPQHHPRSDYGNLEKLQGSIRRDGLQEPLFVYEIEATKFGIIDGARRLKAFLEMGLKQIACLINKGISEADAAHLSYVKNVERKTLSVIEIARHIKNMRDTFGYSIRELELMGYGTPAAISLKLKLLELPESIQLQIGEGKLTAEHGRHLAKLPSEKTQKRMAKRIIDHELSAKRAEFQINRFLAKGNKVAPKKVEYPESEIPGVFFKSSTGMSEQPDKSVHTIVTSPPYHVGMEFETGETDDEHWDNIGAVMNECARVLVDGGIMALNVGNIHNFKGKNGKNDFTQIQLVGHKYQSFLRRHNIYLTDIIAWVKGTNSYGSEISKAWSNDTEHTEYRIIISHDPVYIFRKKGKRDVPSEEIALQSRLTKEEWSRWAHGIWSIPRVHNMEGHPAIYPDELVYRLVKMFSYVGDTVLDPFLGSGTTIKVARELGRVGIGYERELQYKPVIMKKLGITQDETVEGSQESMVKFFERTIDPEFSETEDEPAEIEDGEMAVTEVPMNP